MRVGVGFAVAISVPTIGCDQPLSTKNEQTEFARSEEANSAIRVLTADPQFVWLSTLEGLIPWQNGFGGTTNFDTNSSDTDTIPGTQDKSPPQNASKIGFRLLASVDGGSRVAAH